MRQFGEGLLCLQALRLLGSDVVNRRARAEFSPYGFGPLLGAHPFLCLCTPFVSRCGTGMAGLPDAPSFQALAKGADGTDGSRASASTSDLIAGRALDANGRYVNHVLDDPDLMAPFQPEPVGCLGGVFVYSARAAERPLRRVNQGAQGLIDGLLVREILSDVRCEEHRFVPAR